MPYGGRPHQHYARFADKSELVEGAIDRLVEASMTTVEPMPRDQDPRAFLIAMGTRIITTIGRTARGLIQIALSEGRHFPAIRPGYNDTLARGRSNFKHALEHWQNAGLLPELKDVDMAATLLVSMLTDMARIRVAMDNPMSKQEVLSYITFAIDIFLRGCGYQSYPTFGRAALM